jgi:hypothetical protein
MFAVSFCEPISTVTAECDQKMTKYSNLEQVENETAADSSRGTYKKYEISYQGYLVLRSRFKLVRISSAPFEIQTSKDI